MAFIAVILEPSPFKLVTDILAGNLALSRVPVNLVASKLVIPEPSPDMFVALILPTTSNLSIGSFVFIPTLPSL